MRRLRVEIDYYVYMFFYLDGMTPFYVGKGRGRRMERHSCSTTACKKHTRKNQVILDILNSGRTVPCIKVAQGLSEDQAYSLERTLIDAYGRENLGNGPLLNMSIGGPGVSGFVYTEAMRQRTREACLGRKQSAETIAKRVAKTKGQKRTPEFGQNLSRKLTGRKFTDAHRAALSAGQRSRDPSTRKKSPETLEKMRNSARNRGPEINEKYRQAALVREARKREQRKLND